MVEKTMVWLVFFNPSFCYAIITDDKEFQIKHWYTEPV